MRRPSAAFRQPSPFSANKEFEKGRGFMNNYYKKFPEIRQDMSAEEIRQELNKLSAVIGNRFDAKSLETQEVIQAALEVFRDEESKRAYDQTLTAESAPPKADPAKERQMKQAELLQRAKDFYHKKEYDLAKTAMDRALEQDKDLPNNNLYQLAALIYMNVGEYRCALQYINEALLLAPECIAHIANKGYIYGRYARELAKDSRFSSSPELQAEYQELRTKELEQFRNANAQASGEKERGSTLEHLGWAEYNRANLIDEKQAEKDREAGVQHLREAEKLGPLDSRSQKILKEFTARRERRKQNAERMGKLTINAMRQVQEKQLEQARAEIEEALKLDAEPDEFLYVTAAEIYSLCGDYDTAALYMDKALAQGPEDDYVISVKGQLCGLKAWELTTDSRFSASIQLRSEYQTLRKQELALLGDALRRAELTEDDEQTRIASCFLVQKRLAWAEYFRPNQIDEERAKKDRRAGLKDTEAIFELARQFSSALLSTWNAAGEDIKKDYEKLYFSAQKCYENGEYGAAEVWIEKYLELYNGSSFFQDPYELAAQISLKNNKINFALWYIEKEREKCPESVYHLRNVGEFCGREALALAEDSRFESSPALRKMYKKVHAKELELYQEGCKVARLKNDPREIAYALGKLAWAEYCRWDQIDTAQAERERRAGVEHASEAERVCLGHSDSAIKVLKKHRERMEEWTTQARSHYDKKEYVQAKNVIAKALAEKGDTGGQYLYWLAAEIYLENKELNAALRYIDIALAKAPKNVYNITVKGEIYGRKALGIMRNSSFQTSPELKKEYHTFLAQDWAQMEKAVAVARESGNREEQAYTLGYLAWVAYFRYDVTKENERSDHHRDQGCALARQALELGESRLAKDVLQAEEKMQEEERKEYEKWKRENDAILAELQSLADEYKRNKWKNSFFGRFF
ncbi:hypothetical protein AALC17_12245 [Oscillospiraceae bacterium 38-13]